MMQKIIFSFVALLTVAIFRTDVQADSGEFLYGAPSRSTPPEGAYITLGRKAGDGGLLRAFRSTLTFSCPGLDPQTYVETVGTDELSSLNG